MVTNQCQLVNAKTLNPRDEYFGTDDKGADDDMDFVGAVVIEDDSVVVLGAVGEADEVTLLPRNIVPIKSAAVKASR